MAVAVYRGLLKELRSLQGPAYRDSPVGRYIRDRFRRDQVTSERYCRAQQEALHSAHTYRTLLASSRHHMTLHNLYHARGERSTQQAAGMVGLRLPSQPGGKGWEE